MPLAFRVVTRLRDQDDVDPATIADGLYLRYSAAQGKFVGSTVDLSSRVAKAGDAMSGDLVLQNAHLALRRVGGDFWYPSLFFQGENGVPFAWLQGYVGNGSLYVLGAGGIHLQVGPYYAPNALAELTGEQIWVRGIGSANADASQDALRIQPRSARATHWRPLAIYLTSDATTPSVLVNGAGSLLLTEGRLLAAGGIGVGNSVVASTPGSVVRKIEVFDASGNSLGFLPVYDSIA